MMDHKGTELDSRSRKMQEAISKAIDDAFPTDAKRTPYTDGWPESNWREEMEKHPLFMTKTPDPAEELPPLIQGIQQLKYGEDENTPDELASTYKDDGNFYFKCKKYRDATINYSAGLKQNCSNELKAQLFNNRSAAQFFLQNYKSALNDCEETLKLNPEYLKAKIRSVQCLFLLKRYEECVDKCDDILSQDENNDAIKQIRKDAIAEKKIKDRNLRKERKKEKLQLADDDALLKIILDRKINIRLPDNKKLTKISDLDLPPSVPSYVRRVHLEGGTLVWPVVFAFLEYALNVPVTASENLTLTDALKSIYPEMNDYDPTSKYLFGEVSFYSLDKNKEPILFSAKTSLQEILDNPNFILDGGVLAFVVVLKCSEEEGKFLRTQTHMPFV